MPICTQGMQRTWWPEAGTIIVTGPYSLTHYASLGLNQLKLSGLVAATVCLYQGTVVESNWHDWNHRSMTSKSLMPTAPSCIDDSKFKEYQSPRSRFRFLQSDASVREWAQEYWKKSDDRIVCCLKFPACFHLNQSLIVYVNKNCPHDI